MQNKKAQGEHGVLGISGLPCAAGLQQAEGDARVGLFGHASPPSQ